MKPSQSLRNRRMLAAIPIAMMIAMAIVGACARGDSKAATSSSPVLVFAASDLRDALAEVARQYRASGGDSLLLVFGSTGDLSTQIANGAPSDMFFAANARAIDDLAARSLIVDSTRAVYAIGRLALISRCATAVTATPTDSVVGACPTLKLADLAGAAVTSIAIANPAHAPYGLAAKQALERSGLWPSVEKKLVLGANISQAEQFVTTGNADAGLVALSLVLRDSTRRYTLVDSTLHDPLQQTVAVMAASTRLDAAVRFLRYMRSDAGATVMKRYGFTAPAAIPPQ